jgi:hypothetical protein
MLAVVPLGSWNSRVVVRLLEVKRLSIFKLPKFSWKLKVFGAATVRCSAETCAPTQEKVGQVDAACSLMHAGSQKKTNSACM